MMASARAPSHLPTADVRVHRMEGVVMGEGVLCLGRMPKCMEMSAHATEKKAKSGSQCSVGTVL